MLLSEKGRFEPPPRLKPKYAQSLAETLTGWADVHARTHWLLGDETRVDGADFYVGQHELGHLHLNGEAHVAVGTELRDAVVAAKLAHSFAYSRAFVTWSVRDEASRSRAEWLFTLRYAVLTAALSVQVLKQRIESEAMKLQARGL
jgi:hypothetical protein